MAKTERSKSLRQTLRTADRYFYELFGTHFRTVAARSIDLAATALKASLTSSPKEGGTGDPELDRAYATLGLRPSAEDVVVKGAFRSLVREYHSDTGIHPDTRKFEEVVEAYNIIMFSRAEMEEMKGKETPPQKTDEEATGEAAGHG